MSTPLYIRVWCSWTDGDWRMAGSVQPTRRELIEHWNANPKYTNAEMLEEWGEYLFSEKGIELFEQCEDDELSDGFTELFHYIHRVEIPDNAITIEQYLSREKA